MHRTKNTREINHHYRKNCSLNNVSQLILHFSSYCSKSYQVNIETMKLKS